MIDPDKLDSLCRELDKFIQDNMHIEESGYHMRDDLVGREKDNEIEKYKNFKSEYKDKDESIKPFFYVLDDIGRKLYEKWDEDKSDLWKYALISKDYVSKTKKENIKKINKYSILSIGFALNSKNLAMNNKLNKSAKDIMNELFLSRQEEKITINYADPFDLVIIYCLEKLADTECDITDIDIFLKHEGLPWFSEKLLINYSLGEKIERINFMLDKIKFFKLEKIKQKSYEKEEEKKEKENLEKMINATKKDYKKYFEEMDKKKNANNYTKETPSASINTKKIYLPIFEYIKEYDGNKEKTKDNDAI